MRTDAASDEAAPPRYLYKFRPVSTLEQRAFVRDVICQSQVFFAHPRHFLDPFEFHYARVGLQRDPHVDNNGGLDDHANGLGCLSFSARSDQLLMWAHYADWYRGICLRFDVNSAVEFFRGVRPVFYAAAYPEGTEGSGHRLVRPLEWSHEEEWRILEPYAAGQLRPFPPQALDAVILGCSITTDNERIVRDWVTHRDPPVRIYRSAATRGAFRLSSVPADQ